MNKISHSDLNIISGYIALLEMYNIALDKKNKASLKRLNRVLKGYGALLQRDYDYDQLKIDILSDRDVLAEDGI